MENKIREFLKTSFDVTAELDNLDSLDKAEMAFMLEDEFDLPIGVIEESIQSCKTVDEVVALVTKCASQ